MAKIRDFMRSPLATILLFAIAAALILTGAISGARAADRYESHWYSAQVQMYDIGVTLVENGEPVSWRNYRSNSDGVWDMPDPYPGVLLGKMIDTEKERLQLGRAYDEVLTVRNSGTVDEYVRVSLYKYWLNQDEDGKWVKNQELTPDLIDLHLVNLSDDGGPWILDTKASTAERTVLYYDRILPATTNDADITAREPLAADAADREAILPFSDTITISGKLAVKATQETSTETRTDPETGEEITYQVITTTYDYDGVKFQIEAEVDAVQTHNAEDAIWSAWGVRATITGDERANREAVRMTLIQPN